MPSLRLLGRSFASRSVLLTLCLSFVSCSANPPTNNVSRDDLDLGRRPNNTEMCSYRRLLDHAHNWGEIHPDENGISDAVEWLSDVAIRSGLLVPQPDLKCPENRF